MKFPLRIMEERFGCGHASMRNAWERRSGKQSTCTTRSERDGGKEESEHRESAPCEFTRETLVCLDNDNGAESTIVMSKLAAKLGSHWPRLRGPPE